VYGVDVNVTISLALEVLVMNDLPEKRERAKLLKKAGIKSDLVQPVADIGGRARNIGTIKRI
jgi:hypothetical protein